MTSDEFRDLLTRYGLDPAVANLVVGVDVGTLLSWVVPAVLLVFLVAAKFSPRPDSRLINLGTVLGLAFSAQGMFDVAVDVLDVPREFASIVFIVFDCLLAGFMIQTYRLRGDRARRRKPLAYVWTLATVMGVVVAMAEGWAQAPIRFALPLMIVGGWYVGLTADDDPQEKVPTSWRWTPREVGIALGLLVAGKDDGTRDVNRDRLRKRMTDLAFREKYGTRWVSSLTRRRIRRARLAAIANEADLAEVDASMARAARVARLPQSADESTPSTPTPPPTPDQPETHPTPMEQPSEPVRVPAPHPTPDAEPVGLTIPGPPRRSRPGGVTSAMVDGELLAGDALRDHFVARALASMAASPPNGMTCADLVKSYDGQIGTRVAQGWHAEARKRSPYLNRVNGNVPSA